jgi:hypothetical protein
LNDMPGRLTGSFPCAWSDQRKRAAPAPVNRRYLRASPAFRDRSARSNADQNSRFPAMEDSRRSIFALSFRHAKTRL